MKISMVKKKRKKRKENTRIFCNSIDLILSAPAPSGESFSEASAHTPTVTKEESRIPTASYPIFGPRSLLLFFIYWKFRKE